MCLLKRTGYGMTTMILPILRITKCPKKGFTLIQNPTHKSGILYCSIPKMRSYTVMTTEFDFFLADFHCSANRLTAAISSWYISG